MSAATNNGSVPDGTNTKYFNDSQNKKNYHSNNNVNNGYNNKPNYRQNKNNRNSTGNNVAPLRQQNFNSVTNELPPQPYNTNNKQNPNKFNGGPKKQNKKKGKNNNINGNANGNVNDETNGTSSQESNSNNGTITERLNKSLNNDQTVTTGMSTSMSLDCIGYCNQNGEKRSPVKLITSASFSNTCSLNNGAVVPKVILEQEVIAEEVKNEEVKNEKVNNEEVTNEEVNNDEVKQTPLNESETSLEFTSCCSTPMSHNETKCSANIENVVIEKVIASLDFKSNDMLSIDMDQFNQTNEEHEKTTTCQETCAEVLLDTSANKERQEEQISVIEVKDKAPFVLDLPTSNSSDEILQKEDISMVTVILSPTTASSAESVIFPTENIQETTHGETMTEENQFSVLSSETELIPFISNIISDVLTHTEQKVTDENSLSQILISEKLLNELDKKSDELIINEVADNNFIVIETAELKDACTPINEIKSKEDLSSNETAQKTIIEIASETDMKSNEKATKEDAKETKGSNKKESDSPIDCFPCSIL